MYLLAAEKTGEHTHSSRSIYIYFCYYTYIGLFRTQLRIPLIKLDVFL